MDSSRRFLTQMRHVPVSYKQRFWRRLFTYNHSIMGTEIEVIVAWVTNLAVNYRSCKSNGKHVSSHYNHNESMTKRKSLLRSNRFFTWRNIARASSLEELGVVVLLGNDHRELGAPFFIEKLACLLILKKKKKTCMPISVTHKKTRSKNFPLYTKVNEAQEPLSIPASSGPTRCSEPGWTVTHSHHPWKWWCGLVSSSGSWSKSPPRAPWKEAQNPWLHCCHVTSY